MLTATRQTKKAACGASKRDRTREIILRSAAEMFRDRGYAATTMRDIADAAQMKAGSIYYHFQSKDDILVEILDIGVGDIVEGVRRAIDDCSPESSDEHRIAAAVQAHLGALLSRSVYTSANIRIYGQLPENVRARHRPLRRAYAQVWEGLLGDARNAGAVRTDIDIVSLRQFLLGALNWTVEWYDPTRQTVESLSEQCTRIILDGISTK